MPQETSKIDVLTAQDYFDAARDHAAALDAMYSRGEFALAVYVAGLAVECLFRAYRDRRGLPFTSDHKLQNLADESKLADLVPERNRPEFDAAITSVVVAWRNSHRFRSLEALRRFLKKAGLDRGIRGDYLRENARQLTSAALTLLALGVKRWKH